MQKKQGILRRYITADNTKYLLGFLFPAMAYCYIQYIEQHEKVISLYEKQISTLDSTLSTLKLTGSLLNHSLILEDSIGARMNVLSKIYIEVIQPSHIEDSSLNKLLRKTSRLKRSILEDIAILSKYGGLEIARVNELQNEYLSKELKFLKDLEGYIFHRKKNKANEINSEIFVNLENSFMELGATITKKKEHFAIYQKQLLPLEVGNHNKRDINIQKEASRLSNKSRTFFLLFIALLTFTIIIIHFAIKFDIFATRNKS